MSSVIFIFETINVYDRADFFCCLFLLSSFSSSKKKIIIKENKEIEIKSNEIKIIQVEKCLKLRFVFIFWNVNVAKIN
jgi:hypothetical protein